MDLGKIQQFNYPINSLYPNQKEDTKHVSVPKNPNKTSFRGAYDKYSDKNVILNSVITEERFEKFIKNQKKVDKEGNLVPRFDNYEINRLIDLSKDNKFNMQFINTLINCQMNDYDERIVPRFDADDIEKLVNLADGNYSKVKFIKDLIQEKTIDSNGYTVTRFNTNDIEKLVDLLSKNPDDTQFIKNLINEKTIDSKGNILPRFDTFDVQRLINVIKKNPNKIQFIKDLTNETQIDSNGNFVPRFGALGIEELTNLVKDNSENIQFIKDLINKKTIDSKGNIVPRFDTFDVQRLINAIKKNPKNIQFIKDLINETQIDSNGNTVPRFETLGIEGLTNLVKDNSENIKFIKNLINEKTIDSNGKIVFRFDAYKIESLMDLLNENPDKTQFIKDLINETQIDSNRNTVPRFKANDVEKLTNLTKVNSGVVKTLVSNPKYDIFLPWITQNNIHFFEDKTILNKITNQLNPDNNYFSLNNNYIKNSYQFEFSKDKDKQIFFVTKTDKGLEYNGSETQKTRGDKTLVRRNFQDGSYLIEEIKNIKFVDENIPISLKKTQFDNNGVQIRSEVLTPSKDKPGTYTINVYERGLNQSMVKKPIGTVELYGSKNQGMKYKRTVTSSDGTLTSHTIIQGPKGSGIKYEIKDKDGNILETIERQYRKIDENHYTSSVNGQKYDTQFVGDKVIASKIDKNENKVESIELGSDVLNKKLINLFKQLPGDYFFKIKELGLKKIYLDTSYNCNSAVYYNNNNTIGMSKKLKNNPFVFAHELGHALDWHSKPEKIRNNKDLINIYQKELANYKKQSSDAEGYSIDYFTTGERPLGETIAECYALTSGLINQDEYAIYLRSVVLQQHFPRTCAKIMELIN